MMNGWWVINNIIIIISNKSLVRDRVIFMVEMI